MTSVCPKCKLRVRVPVVHNLGEEPAQYTEKCRVCGHEWLPYAKLAIGQPTDLASTIRSIPDTESLHD